MAKKISEEANPLGRGLDCGTMNLVGARRTSKGVETNRMRDLFLDLDGSAEKMLRMGKFDYVKRDGEILILGDTALKVANVFGKEARRPLSDGLVSPSEIDSLEVLGVLIQNVLGEPAEENEVCYYSVPAAPIDQPDKDIVYHQGVLSRIISECGYNPIAANEAMAIIFSETAEENFSGLAISCLIPGTRIYTENGIVPIEDVSEGDLVLTHKGRWKPVQRVITKDFCGMSTKLQICGYSDTPEDYQFVDNHELLVKRGADWRWVGCEEVGVGDVVGEPILKVDRRGKAPRRPTITLCERVTCSKKYTKKHIRVSGDVQRLIGYFLGDGHCSPTGKSVGFDFGVGEKLTIQDVQDILLKNFAKESTVVEKGGGCSRILCHSVGLHNWFSNHCYHQTQGKKVKKYPWGLDRLTYGDCINLLVGLVRSDGWKSGSSIYFGNSNTHLIFLAKQLFSRVGVAASISCRDPRDAQLKEGRVISGIADEWVVTSGKRTNTETIADFVDSLSCENSKFVEKIFLEDGFCCGRVQKIKHDHYDGTVYDLQIEEDHSFSGPFLTIHNCGSGLTNVALSINTIEGLSFSVAKAGDWIDRGAAQSVGGTRARICALKEQGIDLNNPGSREEEAITFYYKSLIEYVLDQITKQFMKIRDQFALPEAIPMIVSGGTSLPTGFLEFFEEVFEKKRKKFPIQITEIRHAEEPLNAVAHGLLIQALQEYAEDW